MLEYGVLMPPMRKKPDYLMQSVCKSMSNCGSDVDFIGRHYKPCKVLLLYGWGGHEQQRALRFHQGNYVCFDLGYWQRDGFFDRKWRVSVNGWHCPRLISSGKLPPKIRFMHSRITPAKKGGRESGYILLIGNSRKSSKVISPNWTRDKSLEIRAKYPGIKIAYKLKRPGEIEQGVSYDYLFDGEIKDAIDGARLVVCRHSNVAVDAAIHGVPCVCDYGAGSVIYKSDLGRAFEQQPSYKERMHFLRRLSWWQWSIREIKNDGQNFKLWLERQLNAV